MPPPALSLSVILAILIVASGQIRKNCPAHSASAQVSRSRPMKIRTKVFIIDEIHMLSRQAFNALLKTLEEPPPHVKFILATTEVQKIPITILSRCQRYDFRNIPTREIAGHLADICKKEKIKAEKKVAKLDKPLSELTKDFKHVIVQDIEAYVNRSAEVRREQSFR